VNLRFLLIDMIDYLTNEEAFRDKDECPVFGEITKSLNSVLVARTFIEWLSRTPEAVDWLAARGVFVFATARQQPAAQQPGVAADGPPQRSPVIHVMVDGKQRRCHVTGVKGPDLLQVQSVDLPYYLGVVRLDQVDAVDQAAARVLMEQLRSQVEAAVPPRSFIMRQQFNPGESRPDAKPEKKSEDSNDAKPPF
jgi:hypothetical protein